MTPMNLHLNLALARTIIEQKKLELISSLPFVAASISPWGNFPLDG
jgi:hypothetical protein